MVILMDLCNLLYMITRGFQSGISTIVGAHIGRNDIPALKLYLQLSQKLSLGISFVFSVLLWFFWTSLMGVLTSIKDVQKVSEKVRNIYCLMIFFYFVRGVVRGIIKGVGNQEPLVLINFVVYLFIFPLTVHAARSHNYFSHI